MSAATDYPLIDRINSSNWPPTLWPQARAILAEVDSLRAQLAGRWVEVEGLQYCLDHDCYAGPSEKHCDMVPPEGIGGAACDLRQMYHVVQP